MKYALVVFGLFMASAAHAAGVPVAISPIAGDGTPTTVSISTSVWTKIPTSQTSGRVGVYVDDPASNNANMVAHLGNCTSTAIATTVRPIEIVKGEQSSFFPLREDVCLWVLSLHTAAENVHYQEVTN